MPFTVREEKVLVLAAEGQDTNEITNAISNVLTACVSAPSDFKVEELALFDIEYLFLKTRAKSAGETLDLKVQDPEDPTFQMDHKINVDKIKIKKDPEHTDLIEIGEGMVVKMKYPDITFFNEGINLSTVSTQLALIARCVSQIVHGEEVYNSEDMSAGDLEEWLQDLTTEQFQKIIKFFTTMPKLSHTVKGVNTKTGKEFEVVLEGLQDFF